MSLVDYASSDEEEDHGINVEAEAEEEEEDDSSVPERVAEQERRCTEASIDQFSASKFGPPLLHDTQRHNQRSGTTVNGRGEGSSKELEPSVLNLPDATFLLSSPVLPSNVENATDHSSRVAAAMAENASRKRELNGSSSSSSYTRQKLPRGNLPHLKRVQDTQGGNLLPPQLSGRSNIVTEDVSKLFVKKHADPPSK